MRGLALALGVASLSAASASAQEGTVTGQVLHATTGQPLTSVQISISGTNRGGLTNQDGRFLVPNVPAGAQQLRATSIGYATQSADIVVPAGGTVQHTFRLSESAIELGAIVVTATGQQQTIREIGSSVGVVNVGEIDLAPVTSFSDLLQGRTAGTVVTASSGMTGAGSRIRIRGSNSISLSNAPLLVIDGVRVESDPTTLDFGVGGQQPSALDDLNPENIESIEILKGPAASALYGTAAANGVIQVTTKRGRSGAPQFRFWAEYGDLSRNFEFPDNVQAVDAAGDICPVVYQALGFCTPTQTYTYNPLENSETTVFDGGRRAVYGGSVSGGGDDATFYISAERSDEESVYSQDNFMERINLQANVAGSVREDLRVRANVGYVDSDAQFPQSDNALFGAVPMGLFGSPTPGALESTGGYESPIEFHYDWQTYHAAERLTSSVGADWNPLGWLSVNGSAGLEQINRHGEGRIPRVSAYSVYGGVYESGWIQLNESTIRNINTNLSGSAVRSLSDAVVSTTTLGTQYIREDFNSVYAFGATMIPGIETSLAGATTDFSTGEGNVLNATIGAYAQQQFAFNDRIFLNAAVRGDKNTAFGTEIGWIWYPSVSGSWVLSDEEFFPRSDFLNEFRLRAAYGQAGLRPGATDALLSFAGGVGAFNSIDVPAITINEIGNPDLEPERSTEWELGFETSVADGRFGLEATYYSKTSTDALVNRPLPPSPGGSVNRFENLGEVSNSGFEFLLNGEAFRNDDIDWNFGFTGSFNDNELIDLGEDAEGNPIPPIGSGAQRFVEGHPLGGWWQIPIHSIDDADGNGLLTPSEVEFGVLGADGALVTDSVAFHGNALPTRELSFNTDLTLFDVVRVSALLDYKGGHKMLNYTNAWRCARKFNCAATYDQNLSLQEQANIIGYAAAGTYTGFIEDADFVKLREVSVSFMVPQHLGNTFGASDLRLTLAGRNLATWTDYSGVDPEVAWGGAANFTAGDFGTLPPNRIFTVRVDASF